MTVCRADFRYQALPLKTPAGHFEGFGRVLLPEGVGIPEPESVIEIRAIAPV